MVGMLVMVLLVERFVVRRDRDFSNTPHLNWRYAGRMAGLKSAKTEILCFGSSQTKFGVLSRVIEAETGRRTFNLAVCGGNAVSDYFLFRRALRAGTKPVAVVVDFPLMPLTPSDSDGLFGHLLVNQRLWPELLDVPNTLDLARKSKSAEFFARTLAARLLPAYKARFEIRSNILAALDGKDGSSYPVTYMLERNWWANRGACAFPRNPDFEAKHRWDLVRIPPQPDPRFRFVDRLTELYTKRFLTLAAENRIRVFWMVPPVCASHQEEKNRTGQDRRFTRFIRDTQARFPNVVVIDFRRSNYPAEAFFDLVHLNAQGARVLSAELASVVHQHLSTSAPDRLWILSPTYHPPGPLSEHLVEDIHESESVLKHATEIRAAPGKGKGKRGEAGGIGVRGLGVRSHLPGGIARVNEREHAADAVEEEDGRQGHEKNGETVRRDLAQDTASVRKTLEPPGSHRRRGLDEEERKLRAVKYGCCDSEHQFMEQGADEKYEDKSAGRIAAADGGSEDVSIEPVVDPIVVPTPEFGDGARQECVPDDRPRVETGQPFKAEQGEGQGFNRQHEGQQSRDVIEREVGSE